MTVGATNIVAPVLSTTKVVAFFFPGVATQTSLRRFLRSLVLERNDLRRIAFGNMVFARAMTRFAAGRFIFPAAHRRQLRVRGVRIGFELIFVAVFTGIAADIAGVGHGRLVVTRGTTDGLRTLRAGQPHNGGND